LRREVTGTAPPAAGNFTTIAGIASQTEEHTGLRQSVSRSAAVALMVRAGGMTLAFVTSILLARELGAAGFGTYSWAFAWATALAIPAALGADQLLVREGAAARERKDWGRMRWLLGSALGWVAGVAGLGVVVGAAVIVLGGDGIDARRTALLLALPILPLAAVTAVAQGALLGLGRTATALAPGNFGRQVGFLVLVAVAVVAGGLSAAGAVGLQLAATLGAAVAALLLTRRALGQVARRPSSEGEAAPASARDWLRVSLPMGAATMFLVLDAQIGLLVLGTIGTSPISAGLYAAALQCMVPFVLLLAAVRLPLGAAVARLGAAGEHEEMQRQLRKATRVVAAASAVVAAVLFLAPGPILALFGDGFSSGVTALRILALAQLVNALCAFNGMVLIMGGQERAAMRAALGCLVLDAILCVALVPTLGSRGAALAALASITVRNVVNSVQVRRRLGVDATVIGRVPASQAVATRQ
jgi:O-antigen/teichoic acid export membrane protein